MNSPKFKSFRCLSLTDNIDEKNAFYANNIRKPIKINKERLFKKLQSTCGDADVDFLLANPEKICDEFYKNPNDKVVSYIFGLINNGIPNEDMCENPNDRMVDYIISIYKTISYPHPFWNFSANPNDKAVNHLLKIGTFDNYYFNQNPNDKAVDFLIANPAEMDYEFFSMNENDRAVKYIKDTVGQHYTYELMSNENPKIIEVIGDEWEEYDTINENFPVFFYDFDLMRKNFSVMKKAVVEKAMNTNRIKKIIKMEEERLGRELTDMDIDRIL